MITKNMSMQSKKNITKECLKKNKNSIIILNNNTLPLAFNICPLLCDDDASLLEVLLLVYIVLFDECPNLTQISTILEIKPNYKPINC